MNTEQFYFQNFLERARREPDHPCLELHSISRVVSFSEMERGISTAAALLSERGVRAGDVVLIFARHDPGTFWAFFGAQLLGATPSFMSPPTPRQPTDLWTDEHRALVKRIAPALLICGEEIRDRVAKLGDAGVMSTAELEAHHTGRDSFATANIDPDGIAFLQHSSGTTGLKKGVAVTGHQLHAQIETYAAILNLSAKDCVVSWLPVYHDMGLIAATLMPFALGIPITLVDTMQWLEDPSIYLRLLASKESSFSWLPNFAFPFLAQRGELPADADLSRVRAIINCSEPCKANSMASFRSRFEKFGLPGSAIQVCYAMAENVFAVTQTSGPAKVLAIDPAIFESEHRAVPSPNGRPIVSVGRAIPQTVGRIGDYRRDGDVDEVFVQGPSLCSGYHLAPEITAEKFAGGWYRTGDLGFLHEGELYITGRLDDVIIVRGKNLYAHDLEMLVTETGMARAGRVVAFGIDDVELGTEKLVIVTEVGGERQERTVAKAIRAAVREAYGLSPADIVLVSPNTLVKTSSGKVSRSENRRRYLAKRLQPWDGQHAPEDFRAD